MIPSNIDDYPVIDQYEMYYRYYSKKYGKVAVMYQHGAHYNFFGTKDFGNMEEISQDATIILTYSDKNKGNKNTKENPTKAGFPVNSKDKYIEKFIIKGYTVVEINEMKATKKCDRLPREVVNVYTPGTYDSDYSDENYIVYIYIEGHKDPSYNPMIIGMSAIDVNTGECDYIEVYNNQEDEGYAVDEMYRYIQAHSPKEILLYCKNAELRVHNSKIVDIPKEMEKESCMIEFLENIFSDRGICGVVDYLDMEMTMYARKSLSYLLYYVFEHNKTLIHNLKKPVLWYSEENMLLANNAIQQLDIVNSKSGKTENIFNLVNFTSTAMGKRLLKSRLTNPSVSVEEIEKRYDMVESFDNWKDVENILSGMVDLHKEHRKIERRVLTPLRLSYLLDSYTNVMTLLDTSHHLCKKKEVKMMKKYICEMMDIFEIEECRKYNVMSPILSNIFKKGVSKKLDKIGDVIKKCHENIDSERVRIKKELGGRANPVIGKDDNLGYYLKLTETQAKKLDLKELPTRTKNKFVQTQSIKENSDLLMDCEEKISEKISKFYLKFLKYIENEYRNIYTKIANFVAETDLYKSSAKCAQKYNYSRPTIVEKEKGFISCENLRHPLIEQNGAMYVPHTFSLSDGQQGMLIYGMNASGKSSLMKALGVNLVMAQAGLYTATSKFEFTPYKNIQTRILGNDNIFRGLSSFAVEMSELRGILGRAKNKSLVLGDEICHGTETISGIAIVAASVLDLISKDANFIFATHLHELVEIAEIKSLLHKEGNLGVYHLKVERDGRKLIYRRHLESGTGDSLYGLEVARALNIPEEFIERANSIRKKVIGDELLGKKSRYGKNHLGKCAVCGKMAEDDHHIRFQKESNKNGFIDHFHKNHPLNRVGLCKKCHIDLHKGHLTIKGYVETSEGLVLE